MPEPVSTAASTLVAATVAVPAITLLGVPLGLRPDVLVAGFAGAFEWGGHLFDVDPVNLTGAAVDAMLADQAGETYAQAWVLADNTVIELDAQQQIEVGRACKAFVASLWTTSQQLRGEIYAAETVEAVNSLTWPTP